MLLLVSTVAAAQESYSDAFLLPFEVDFDSGADNGDAIIGRLLPTNNVMVREKWRLLNVAIVTFGYAPGGRPGSPGNPDPVAGPKVFGLSDLTDGLFYSRTTAGGLTWGIGAGIGVPIASDPSLGSGKWQAGPAFRLGYRAGPWQLALLGMNRWSFAGDKERADVHQLLMRGIVRRNLGGRWFFISAPIITANWKAASGEEWLVPLGGGLGRNFRLTRTEMNVSLQGYVNAIRPAGAPDWLVRVGVTFPFQLPL